MNGDSICSVMFIIGGIIVAIGIYPYIIRLIRAGHAATDSVSDYYHHNIKPKQNKRMTIKNINEDSEFYIDPEEVKLDGDELEVKVEYFDGDKVMEAKIDPASGKVLKAEEEKEEKGEKKEEKKG